MENVIILSGYILAFTGLLMVGSILEKIIVHFGADEVE